MDEKRPENDFRVDNNIARTADNTFGLKEAAIANGGGGSLKDIAEAIKAIGSGSATKIKPADLAADNAPAAGKIVAVKSGDSFTFTDAAPDNKAHLTITGNDLQNKLLLVDGKIHYNVPTYLSNEESEIFDLRNNYPTAPVLLKIADETITVQNLRASSKVNSDLVTVYADLDGGSGFNVLFSKDKDGKIFAWFLGSAVPPVFRPIGKFTLQRFDFSLGVKFDTRYHHFHYTRTLFISNPNLLTATNPYIVIAERTGWTLVNCYDWTVGRETGNFEKVNFMDYTKKYKLLRIDIVSDSEAFITPMA